jgi:hypothetical protein
MEVFEPFPKIPRLKRIAIVTEKIDGTNAQVCIGEDGQVRAGSRTRWITPENDNMGFARWVKEHEEELRQLGPGRHFGEWWGQGIQRRYGLDHKRFSLFNTSRWNDPSVRPACCHVGPVVWQGDFSTTAVENALSILRERGSFAAPGFMNPEGVVVFHTASGGMSKITLDGDAIPKSLQT